jgi:hypothetical protein
MSTPAFSMKIVDLFHFSDGRTVFVGPATSEPKFVRACKCELLVDSELRSVIQIEGEMMPDRNLKEGYRSVSTRDAIQLDKELLAMSDCRLASVSQ